MIKYTSKSSQRGWAAPLIIAAALCAGIIIGYVIPSHNAQPLFYKFESGQSSGKNTLDEILRYIELRYYRKIDMDAIRNSAIDQIFTQLDPYSEFISADKVHELKEQMNGQFSGIGIEYTAVGDSIGVVRVIEDGPAAKAGIQQGDYITGANNIESGKSKNQLTEVIHEIKGKRGESLTLKVLRFGKDEPMMVELVRDNIQLTSVGAALMVNDSVGYIHLRNFNANAYKEFMESVEYLAGEPGMKHLIFDLRGNPGGLMQEAVNILSQFYKEKGRLLVYTEGSFHKKNEYKTTGNRFFDIGRIAVLIDQQSASASEIVAGALQDTDRAVIIGRSTFGKGLVQEVFPLKDGSAVRLTIAKYFTPSGRSIQKPFEKDRVLTIDTSMVFSTSGGRRVNANGGIDPDIFTGENHIVEDDSLNQEMLVKLGSFSFEYFRNHIGQKQDVIYKLQNREEKFMEDLSNALREFSLQVFGKHLTGDEHKHLMNIAMNRLLLLMMDEKDFYQWHTQSDEAIQKALIYMYDPSILRSKN